MNVLLVHPQYSFLLKTFQDISLQDIPLNLAYIAAVLEKAGHVVHILDLNVEKDSKALSRFLRDHDFDMIGFTSTTPIIPVCFSAMNFFRRQYPRSKVVLGGWHASALPVQTMEECPAIDFIVKGEGEETIEELACALSSNSRAFNNIKGLVYRSEAGEILVNEDRPLISNLDSIPFPARHLLPYDKYRKHGFYTVGGYFKRDVNACRILTSRGCTNRCKFCADHVIYKNRCRFRSAENIVAELELMVKDFNIRIVFFNDENFMLDANRVKKLCELIIQRRIRFWWVCMARVDSVRKDVLVLMKRAGCIRISFGIESGSQSTLAEMRKNITIPQIKKAMSIANEVGVPVYGYFVFGMPGETLVEAKKTRDLIMEIKPDYITQSLAIPYPGTDLYEDVMRRGLIKEGKDWASYSYFFNNIIDYPGYNDVVKFQRTVLRDFYTSPFFLLRTLKNLKTIYHLFFYIRGLKDLVLYLLLTR